MVVQPKDDLLIMGWIALTNGIQQYLNLNENEWKKDTLTYYCVESMLFRVSAKTASGPVRFDSYMEV